MRNNEKTFMKSCQVNFEKNYGKRNYRKNFKKVLKELRISYGSKFYGILENFGGNRWILETTQKL